MRRLTAGLLSPVSADAESTSKSDRNSIASISASSMISMRSSAPSASKPHDNRAKREQNPRYGHYNGLNLQRARGDLLTFRKPYPDVLVVQPRQDWGFAIIAPDRWTTRPRGAYHYPARRRIAVTCTGPHAPPRLSAIAAGSRYEPPQQPFGSSRSRVEAAPCGFRGRCSCC